METYRHGDIFFRKVEKVEGNEVRHNGSFVVAEGETTGHKHVVKSQGMEIRQTADGRFYISLTEAGTLSHEEHKTITLPVGDYEVSNEREKDWFSISVRKVVD